MYRDLIFTSEVLQPGEASSLHQAVTKAATSLRLTKAITQVDRERLAGDVIRIAKAGYTRDVDGTLNTDDLAAAAVTRFNSFVEL